MTEDSKNKELSNVSVAEIPRSSGNGQPSSVLRQAFFLFVAQGVAAQFIYNATPAFLRKAGHGPQVVSLVFIIFIPFLLRSLWAPLIDQFGSARIGHRRSWILPCQIAQLLVVVGLFLAKPESALAVLALSTVFTLVLATQASASGAYLLENVPNSSHAQGASLQAFATTLSGVGVGAGVLITFGDAGWNSTLSALLAIVAMCTALVFFLRIDSGKAPHPLKESPRPNFRMFRRRNVRQLFYLLVIVHIGIVLPFGIKTVIQVDAGMSMAEIGVVGVIGGNTAGLIGAVLTYPLVKGLGGRPTLVIVCICATFLYSSMALLIRTEPIREHLAAGYILSSSALTYALYVASRTLILGVCEKKRAATELSTFFSLEGAVGMFVAGGSGSLLGLLGAPTLFALSASATALTALGIFITNRKTPRSSAQRNPHFT